MTSISAFDREKITLPSGLVLEATLTVPPRTVPTARTVSKLAVCLHPWSWLGGRMDDPVLHTLKRELLAKGYHVLRYNSRGVGGSSGWPSFSGLQEGKDLEELVQWTISKMQSVERIIVVGYSYGSLIASLYPLPKDEPSIPVSHILVSYPVGPRTLLTAFHGAHYTKAIEELIQDARSDILLVYGDQDDFTGVDTYDTWTKRLREVHNDSQGRLEIVKIEDANHFWAEAAPRQGLIEAVRNFVR